MLCVVFRWTKKPSTNFQFLFSFTSANPNSYHEVNLCAGQLIYKAHIALTLVMVLDLCVMQALTPVMFSVEMPHQIHKCSCMIPMWKVVLYEKQGDPKTNEVRLGCYYAGLLEGGECWMVSEKKWDKVIARLEEHSTWKSLTYWAQTTGFWCCRYTVFWKYELWRC